MVGENQTGNCKLWGEGAGGDKNIYFPAAVNEIVLC